MQGHELNLFFSGCPPTVELQYFARNIYIFLPNLYNNYFNS